MECGLEFDRILASLAEQRVIDGSATVQHIGRIYSACTECPEKCETARVLLQELDEPTFKSLLLFLIHARDGEVRLVKTEGKLDVQHVLPNRRKLTAME